MKRMVGAGVVTLATLVLTATSALAATLPVLARGTRGQDVALMQRLLTHGGEPIAITALYGPTTEEYVQRFQAKRGLDADGVVGPATWRALMPRLQRGDSGVAVVGLQTALNTKYGYKLSPDGEYGPLTEQAVRSFQSHMGLTVNGVADYATWTALAAHFEELPMNGPGWYRYRTINADGGWGRSHVVATLKEVFEQWETEGHGVRIGVGDLSLPHGGPIPDHASHRLGVDVDLAILRNDGKESRVNFRDAAYSRRLTQRLVELLLATGQVEVIFFNDPAVNGATYWPNHDSHMHVRFRR